MLSHLTRSRYEPARAGLRTWLTALARHKSADVIRHWTRQHPLHLNETAIIEPPGREPDPATVFERRKEQSSVHTALALLLRMVHRIGARAERRVEQELLEDLKRSAGKNGLLFQLAEVSLRKPDGIVKDVVYPVVNE